jgi:hypothetical protein
MKAIFLLATLKHKRAGGEFSHTETLCELVIEEVGGIVITGEEDGEQHITGNIANFLLSVGVTLPPLCAVSYLGNYARATKQSLRKRLREDKSTARAAETMARNLAFFGRILHENEIPEGEDRNSS